MTDDAPRLVPGRTCGDCTVCCKVLPIDSPEMTKLPGVLCRHSGAGGQCMVYAKRPGDCAAFFCGWRLFPLPDQWRPDRSQILIVAGNDTTPDGRQDTVRIHLFGKLDRILWPPLMAWIGHLLSQNVPVYLSVPGKRDEVAARVFLSASANVHNAYASRDPQQIAAVLWDCVQICVEHPKEKLTFQNPIRP